MPAWAGTQRKRIWNMRGCFDHYTGGTYDHIRMDCLFIIYGLLLLFGRMRWLEKLWELLHRTREGMDRASQLRAVENRHRLMEFQQKIMSGTG